jgi:DNA polymerase III delta prime subunit
MQTIKEHNMKRLTGLLGVLFAMAVLVSCGAAGGFTASSREDKDLFKAINAIEKSNHAEARKDLPSLYQQSVQRHEDKLASYKNSTSPERWQKIVAELQALQNIYSALNASPASAKLVPAPAQDYAAAIREAKEQGAVEFYETGVQFLQSSSRKDARKAYDAFQAANKLSPNYKDASNLMREAREKSILDVVINPVQTRGYAYANWGFRSDNFQRELVRDLGGSFGNTLSGARFYTDLEARGRNVNPDWVIDLNWENVYISPSRNHTSTRNVSRQIEIGRDTSGRAIYKTVTATLYITQRSVNARADMEYRVTDLDENDNVEWNRIPAHLDLNIEEATYRGDSRALSEYDWALVNNRQPYRYLDEGEIMDALYARVYPQLRSRIETVTRW